MQATGSANRPFQPERYREVLGEGIDSQPVERHEEVRLRRAHPHANLFVGSIETGENTARLQLARDDAATERRARSLELHALFVVERRPLIEERFGDRSE